MRKLKENKPEFDGRFLIPTPPMSNDVHVASDRGLGGSAIGATVDDGWLAFPLASGGESDSNGSSGGGFGFGFGLVIGIADFATVRDAIALARAR